MAAKERMAEYLPGIFIAQELDSETMEVRSEAEFDGLWPALALTTVIETARCQKARVYYQDPDGRRLLLAASLKD